MLNAIKKSARVFYKSWCQPPPVPMCWSKFATPCEGEQIDFDVRLLHYGQKKVSVIKVIRELTCLDIWEARDLVNAAPVTIKECITLAEAEEFKTKLEAVGATIELK